MILRPATSRTRRLLLVPALFAVSTGVLVGCSDSGSTETASTSASAAPTTGTGTADGTATETSTAPAAGGETVDGAELTGRLQAALQEAGSYKITTTMPGAPAPSVSEVVYQDGKINMSATADFSGMAMELISLRDGEELFIKSEALQIPTWTKVEAGSENPIVAGMAAQMEQLQGSMDPAAQVKVYSGYQFTNEGPDTVNGVATTKYTGEIEAAQLMAALGQTQATPPAGEMVRVELFVDEQNRPVKSVTDISGTAVETTYSDFGSPITIEAPAVGS